MRLNNAGIFASLTIGLISFQGAAGIHLGPAYQLLEIPGTARVFDALLLQKQDQLLISKTGEKKELLTYNINFAGQSITFDKRQRFLESPPVLIENRDFVLGLAPHRGKHVLFRQDADSKLYSYYNFTKQLSGVAATRQSNFVATVDYEAVQEFPNLITPRVKLFTTSKAGLSRTGNALGIINVGKLIESAAGLNEKSWQNLVGVVTALEMSPLSRVKEYPANRVLALGHTARNRHNVHLWYFPDVKKDWDNYQGHFTISADAQTDTIAFSPNTFGLIVLGNQKLGQLYVLKIDFANKLLMEKTRLVLEEPLNDDATHIVIAFGPNDEIIAGVNQSLYEFKREDNGKYKQVDISPVPEEFVAGENFARIFTRGSSFVLVGDRGAIQFGKID